MGGILVVNKKRRLNRTSAFDVLLYAILTFALLVCLIPMMYVVTVSITPYSEVIKHGGFVLFPTKLDFSAYEHMFMNSGIPTAYRNTIFITVIGTALNIVLTVGIAYPLSRKNVPGSTLITFFVLFTMLFNGGMIPTYLIVKQFGLINNIWALIIPQAIMPYNVFLMRTFFAALPQDLFEAAEIDGSGEIRTMLQIAVPLSKPMLMTNLLFYAVIRWNTYMSSVLYITNADLRPLQVVLREILIGADATIEQAEYTMPTQTLKMAAVVLTALPITIVYPFVQKHFTKGMMLGAIKG